MRKKTTNSFRMIGTMIGMLLISGSLMAQSASGTKQAAAISQQQNEALLHGTNSEISLNLKGTSAKETHNGSKSAVQESISGTVTDANTGESLPAVNIQVKGTTTGTSSDADGNYELTVSSLQDTLLFSFIGYQKKVVPINGRTTINVALQPSVFEGEELVVTALGIKRERKSLGYGVQQIEEESLVESHEPNVTNALTGKVAGLQVVRSSTGPAGSSKILLRGYTSLTGDNQPLIVVDGVPIDNFTGMSNNDFWNPSLDMGNGLSDINPNDIASLTVLKGPSAAALYGSRAGNGAILITTKTGTKNPGLGISVSSTLGFSSIFTSPEMQDAFGQGSDGVFDSQSSESWGPKTNGQEVTNWNDNQVGLQTYNNIDNYQRVGITNKQNISFSQKYKSTSVYASFNRLNDQGIAPGQKYERTNLMARATSTFGEEDRWFLDTKVQYNNSEATNRPQGGTNISNVFHTMYMLPRSLDIRNFDPSVDQYGNMIWYEPSSSVNPYWAAKYNLNSDTRDRFILNASLEYQFFDWLSAKFQAGSDIYNTDTESRLYAGSPIRDNGQYGVGKKNFRETDFRALITGEKDHLFGKLGGSFTLGGNLMSQKSTSLDANSGELEVPDLFALNNGIDKPTVNHGFSKKKINSVYGTFGINWDQYLFLNATFRNDWSSTLSSENRSYFYPSVSLSYVLTEMLDSQPSWLSYTKFRASYATVGNSLPPYQLYNTYNISKDPNGNTVASRNNVLYDPSVRSELIKSYEAGVNARFFDYRIGIDFSWYRSNATRQLINIPMDPLSGYSAKKVNAGNIQNSGIEIILDAEILRSTDSFNWDMNVNFSKNNNVVKELSSEVTEYSLGGYDELQIMAVTGQPFGEIYGTQFKRVEDESSPHHGELLLDGNGLPQEDPDRVLLGNQQADFLLGITNTFNYKGLSFSFLIDGRFGGDMFSATLANMQAVGTAEVTAPGGKREEFVVDGVIESDNGFAENTNKITQQQYWQAVQTGNIGITEANLYDATNVRLRNVQLNYTLPSHLLQNTPIRNTSIGVSMNNVWMISSNMHGLDPESVFSTGTNAVGFENATPPTARQLLFNVSFSF